MSIINQICKKVTKGKILPAEIEDYLFHFLRKRKHLPNEILKEIILVKELQDTLRFVFYNDQLIGIMKEEEIRERERGGLLTSFESDIKIPSIRSILKIINTQGFKCIRESIKENNLVS